MPEENNANLQNPIGTVELIPALASTDRVTMGLWSIAGSCEHPEAAMKTLNELYSNPELSNLYMYGIEGVHYESNRGRRCYERSGQNRLSGRS